jgi:hypothetical protein
MICDAVPCECNKPTKHTSAERPSKSSQSRWRATPPAPDQSTEERPVAAQESTSLTSARVIAVANVEQLVEDDAIRALAPLLANSERERFKLVLTTEPSPREKAAVWKWRREHGPVD